MDLLQINKPGARLPCWLSITGLTNRLLLLYIFTMPFVSAFAFTGTITLPLLVALLLLLLGGLRLIQYGRLPDGFMGFDILIIVIFFPWVIFSYCINGLGNAKSLNHTVAYISSFTLFYVAIKYTLFNTRKSHDITRKILQVLAYTTILNGLFVCVEFITSNLFDVNLNDYIPRPSEEEAFYDASVLELFYRARGFAPESGHFTFMMELFFPFSIYYLFFSGYCKIKSIFKVSSTVVMVFSIIFAASSASFIIIPFAFLLSFLIYFKKFFIYLKARLLKFLISISLLSCVLFLINYSLSISSFILLSLTDKMDSTSLDDRQARIDFFFDSFSKQDLMHKLCGTGPAGFDILGFDDSKSILSLYYSITFELGFIGLLLIVLLFCYFLFYAVKAWSKMGFFSLVSVISGILHYYFIANFWYPWFWFVGAFLVFSKKEFK